MTFPTSAIAYRVAMKSGLIPRARERVYTYLFLHGPATAREIFEGLGAFAGSITPRLVELEAQGVVARAGTRVSGPEETPAIVWKWTPAYPAKLSRAVSWKEKAETLAEAIRAAEVLTELKDFLTEAESLWGKKGS